MKIFSFMRKPLKPLLYGALLTLLCTVALIFFLQYQADRQTLDDWLTNYAYVGTIYPDVDGQALLSPLPEDTKALLQKADTIESLHSMQSYAAKLTDGNIIVDNMMSLSQLQQHYFVQAKVTHYMDWGSSFDFKCDRYTVELVKEWGSNKVGTRSLHVNLYRYGDEPAWEVGQEVFFISGYIFDGNAVMVTEFELYTPTMWEMMTGQPPTDVFSQNPYLLLEEGQGEQEILAFMDETGITPYFEKFTQLEGNLTVRAIDDFYALPKTANDRIYITDGRALAKQDAGKKFCMISQNLANRNRYYLGDIVTLSIADDSYSLYGWENGYPMPEDDLITSYAPGEAYEIVGIYNQIGRDSMDPLFFSHTDIFIPIEEETTEFSLPYAFSFRVLGPDYDTFCEETLPQLENSGSVIRLADTGWQDVEDAFYAMELRCTVMFWCSILTFVAAALVFSVLLFWHLRMEYGLQRLMGAYRYEASQVYFAAIAAIAVPALILASIIGQLFAKSLLLAALLLPLALLVAICALLLLFLGISERGSVRKIIM